VQVPQAQLRLGWVPLVQSLQAQVLPQVHPLQVRVIQAPVLLAWPLAVHTLQDLIAWAQ
jgi:hypothetical protein